MRPTVLLLLDAPRSASLVRKIAQDTGELQATRVYHVLVNRAIRAAKEAGFGLAVWYRPADGRSELEHLIGPGIELRAQASGGIGARVGSAASSTNYPTGWIALLRPLAEIDSVLLWAAAERLLDAPVVIGPAEDGGVYLAGARIAPPAALTALEDAGPGALQSLRTGLDTAGIRAAELQVRRTVDSARDARAAGLTLNTK